MNLLVQKVLQSKIFHQMTRLLFKVIVYNSIFMIMEMGGRFMKYGSEKGFISMPLWMLLVYTHIAWLDDLLIPYFKKKNIPLWTQAFFVMLLFNLFELIFGLFFIYGLNIKVWDYSRAVIWGYKVNFMGIVSLYGLFAWYGVALFLLWLYPRVKCMADYRNNTSSTFTQIE